jgi:hypothetical protein
MWTKQLQNNEEENSNTDTNEKAVAENSGNVVPK